MNNSQLAYLLKYCSTNSILVVTKNNKLIQLNCPFKVIVLYAVAKLKSKEIKTVTKIKISNTLKIVFLIDGELYHYYHFDIIIK